jgi:uncharacterized protein
MKMINIWIDLDNSPHVPFFVPISHELEKQGHSIYFTARNAFQVCGLADSYGLSYTKIGKHWGANVLLKAFGTILRSFWLAGHLKKVKPNLSISHGSRSLIIASAMLRIPTILIYDYEHAEMLPFVKPFLGVTPAYIQKNGLERHFKKGIQSFSGLKEDVYACSFVPDINILDQLGIREDEILVTIRPPATEAHYHNPEAEKLFFATVEMLGGQPNLRMVILPRNEKTQKELIKKTWSGWYDQGKIIIPEHVVDGLNLIWHSDLVVSGGGTMNREAAALGVPVYSIFRGKLGAVDRYLSEKGRLVLIETVADVESKIRPIKRDNKYRTHSTDRTVLNQIIHIIEEAITEINSKPITT